MYELNITTGHNSSAVLTKNKKVICGYEEERLSKVKSDSSFPKLAIEKIISELNVPTCKISHVNISHWYKNMLDLITSKHCDNKYLKSRFKYSKIRFTGENGFTHHDTHAHSIWNFSKTREGLTVVMDGFGSNFETISIYENGFLTFRKNSLFLSMGLMYQYAVDFLGMKMNQDEYKLLGYEQKLDLDDERLIILNEMVDDIVNYKFSCLSMPNKFDLSIEEYTSIVKNDWFSHFEKLIKLTGYKSDLKPLIAKFVQNIIEKFTLKIINIFNNHEFNVVQLSGGIFYNVKLNNHILRNIQQNLFINPVAGDQGCALGMIEDLNIDNLNIGIRNNKIGLDNKDEILLNIQENGFYNLFRGNMEFGPRALCNTSTLALPKLDIVHKINLINKRDTVMPMAPIVTKEFADKHFPSYKRIGFSKNYMTIALDFIESDEVKVDDIRGALHYDKDRNVYTGRIQVIENDEFILDLLNEYGGILINTSFNAHGQPILFDLNDIVDYVNITKTNF